MDVRSAFWPLAPESRNHAMQQLLPTDPEVAVRPNRGRVRLEISENEPSARHRVEMVEEPVDGPIDGDAEHEAPNYRAWGEQLYLKA